MVRSGALTLVGLLALTACGGGGGDRTGADGGDGGDGGGGAATPEAAEIRLWLNGGDTSDELRAWLVENFEDQNPGSRLVIEEQDWTGLVPRLQTALTSESQTPDVVEIGNTQAAAFTYAGAFADITDLYEEVGGDKLLEGFVEAGTVEDTVYALPYYSGARAVFYRKDLLAAAGLEVPTTLAEFTETAIALHEANPADTRGFSGFWLPGQDWYNGTAWIYSYGGELAVQDDGGRWTGALSSPESQEALAEVQRLFTEATSAPRDADSNEPWVPFNNGEAGMFSAPTWARWSIDLPECNKGVDPEDTSAEAQALREEQMACNEEKTGIFPLPGMSEGEVATVFAGGSNLAIPAKSQHPELAANLVRLIFSEEYQTMLAEGGLIPGNSEYTSAMGDDVYSQAAIAAALDAKLTPPAEKWADVEADRLLEDFFQKIAGGADPMTTAEETDRLIAETLG